MAKYNAVNGVYRKVAKKYDQVDGVYRNVTKAYESVDGVYRQYFDYITGTVVTASTLSVGDTVLLNVNGVPTKFLVIHQGRPSTTYASNCNGTWLMWKNGFVDNKWMFMDNRDIEAYLTENLKTMFSGAFDADIESGIKTVNIPFYYPYEDKTLTGTRGPNVKFFLLSAIEVGFTGIRNDGDCLSYFNGATNEKRIIPEGQYLLRTAYGGDAYLVYFVGADGAWLRYDSSRDNSVVIRPAFILNNTTQVLKIEE